MLTQNGTIYYSIQPMGWENNHKDSKEGRRDEGILLESIGILSAAKGNTQTLFETFETALSAHTTMDSAIVNDECMTTARLILLQCWSSNPLKNTRFQTCTATEAAHGECISITRS
jgi:hypothetical protein